MSGSAVGSRNDAARMRLLGAAYRLMYERGYEAVGVAELCASAEVKKGSFYHFFDSKQALAVAMLDHAWAVTRDTLFAETLGNPAAGAVEAIDEFGNRLADNLHRRRAEMGSVVGCCFGNFASELSTRDDVVRSRLAGVFDEMTAICADCLDRAIGTGELSTQLDAHDAARRVITHMEGLMVMAKARRDPDLLRTLGGTARRLVDA